MLVEDQGHAKSLYTDVLGFVVKHDIPLKARWLTVVSPEGHADVELVLEANDNPAAKDCQRALFDQGFPLTIA